MISLRFAVAAHLVLVAVVFLATNTATAQLNVGDNRGLVVACDFPRGLCGARDDKGNVVIEPKFEWIDSPFVNGYARYFVQGKAGLIDESGMIILPAIWEQLGDVSLGYVQAKQGDRVGLIDLKGSWVIQPHYSAVLALNDDLFAVETRRCESNECRVISDVMTGYGIIYPADCISECESIDPSWHLMRRDGSRFSPLYFTAIQPIELPVKNFLFARMSHGLGMLHLKTLASGKSYYANRRFKGVTVLRNGRYLLQTEDYQLRSQNSAATGVSMTMPGSKYSWRHVGLPCERYRLVT
jgi:WG containing repeat